MERYLKGKSWWLLNNFLLLFKAVPLCKGWLCFFIFIQGGYAPQVFSQVNLINNPSLEDTAYCTSCPPCFCYSSFFTTKYWYSALSSPDYFKIPYNVPNTQISYQWPHHGNAFGGAGIFHPPTPPLCREYSGVGLIDSLKAGKYYCAEFWVNPAGCNSGQWATFIDRIGIYFSQDSVIDDSSIACSVFPYVPQVENAIGNIITDTAGWTSISGEFVAAGGERFMTFGNFSSDASTQTQDLPAGGCGNAYYFFDDFSLVLIPDISYPKDFADAGEDKNICPAEGVQLGTSPIPGCYYSWQPTTGLNNDTLAQPTASPTQTTTYILTVQTYSTVCRPATTLTDTVTVFIEECPIEAVNIFTPNNDGKNEYFIIKNLPPNSKLLIFNRWGSKVYSSDNYDPEYSGWDGGKVPDGTYFYILTLQNKKTYHGFVEIRR